MVFSHPFEKYARQIGSSSQGFAVKIPKIFELPPPSYRSMLIYSQYFTIHFFGIFGPLGCIWSISFHRLIFQKSSKSSILIGLKPLFSPSILGVFPPHPYLWFNTHLSFDGRPPSFHKSLPWFGRPIQFTCSGWRTWSTAARWCSSCCPGNQMVSKLSCWVGSLHGEFSWIAGLLWYGSIYVISK